MKTILLAGYRYDTNPEDAPGLQTDANGKLRLDLRIEKLMTLGHEIICVLSGPAADLQIRRSARLEEVELVFDNNDREVSLLTNVRAGLAAAGEDPCFCLPVEIPWPSDLSWTRLTEVAWTDVGDASLAQRRDPGGQARDFGFPLLITRRGTRELARLDDLRSLVDPRLEYLYLNL